MISLLATFVACSYLQHKHVICKTDRDRHFLFWSIGRSPYISGLDNTEIELKFDIEMSTR